ncbi:hypothetical protein FJZ36_13200 [Candidatus Poribacteria bacterium]|nr:hypothetical protein [Candidatus Poribacteria bacterium]
MSTGIAGGEPPIASLGYIDSLQRCLEASGSVHSKPYLMGMSGEAFKFFYDRARPSESVWVFLSNPLRSASSALGYRHVIEFSESAEGARAALDAHFEATGKPAILPFGQTFPLVYPDHRVELDGVTSGMSASELMEAWTPGEGFLELGLYGYYFFALRERDREPKAREIYLGSFRRAMKIAKAYRRVRGCTIGLQAYDELAAVLAAKRDLDRVTPSEPFRIASWNGLPSRLLHANRQAAILFLRDALGEFSAEEEQKAVLKAVGFYERTAAALAKVLTYHPTLETDDPTKHVLQGEPRDLGKAEYRRFFRSCRRASLYVERARSAEDKACDELQNIINISEKTKM